MIAHAKKHVCIQEKKDLEGGTVVPVADEKAMESAAEQVSPVKTQAPQIVPESPTVSPPFVTDHLIFFDLQW